MQKAIKEKVQEINLIPWLKNLDNILDQNLEHLVYLKYIRFKTMNVKIVNIKLIKQ